MALPPDWKAGEMVSVERSYGEPPESTDPERHLFFGLYGEDPGHRIYDIPANVKISEIVRQFRVGSQGAMSYGLDENQTVETVALNADKIAAIIPCRVIFADEAGLKLKFEKQISESELAKIESLFPLDDAMGAGLEKYISEWDGESRLLGSLLAENLIHFWWD